MEVYILIKFEHKEFSGIAGAFESLESANAWKDYLLNPVFTPEMHKKSGSKLSFEEWAENSQLDEYLSGLEIEILKTKLSK